MATPDPRFVEVLCRVAGQRTVDAARKLWRFERELWEIKRGLTTIAENEALKLSSNDLLLILRCLSRDMDLGDEKEDPRQLARVREAVQLRLQVIQEVEGLFDLIPGLSGSRPRSS